MSWDLPAISCWGMYCTRLRSTGRRLGGSTSAGLRSLFSHLSEQSLFWHYNVVCVGMDFRSAAHNRMPFAVSETHSNSEVYPGDKTVFGVIVFYQHNRYLISIDPHSEGIALCLHKLYRSHLATDYDNPSQQRSLQMNRVSALRMLSPAPFSPDRL